ncbi:MAG: alpha-1,4-glucan--maltose-1-phosphate maltosyltransferase [Pirellulales bacterium]|nr:alpha-1,4-glucan--maltose-1-phosphate maltosyltransferase [Pirellulales bacterium]
MDVPFPADGRRRVVIDNLRPQVDGGRFPVKRIVHDPVTVQVAIFADGHDSLTCYLRYRSDERQDWQETPLAAQGNDEWSAELRIDRIGWWQFTAIAWIDHFATWRYELTKRAIAGQDLTVDLQIGANYVASTADRLSEKNHASDKQALLSAAAKLRDAGLSQNDRVEIGLHHELEQLMLRHADRALATEHPIQSILVERPKARFSTWYELFPRSCGTSEEPNPGQRHGTLRDVITKLPRIAEMGFDILYLPPIHPIGTTYRKGKNNQPQAQPDDVGSPWGIGGAGGGHTAIHPQLGTFADFQELRVAAEKLGIELALDIAFQCSPEHPYVTEHRDWFKERPDGTIQYAENPPKKYQDIYPFDFESGDWRKLWQELKGVFEFWINAGVHVFRVDNPHTKAFPFWEWAIGSLKRAHPELIFLSEAFTRPKIKYRLAKLGYTQSYTYFTWRNEKAELIDYFTELTTPPVNQFFRPNLWPNTPDILHAYLQTGGRPAFVIRLVLAATLGASYGMYGPAYELCDNTPRDPGSEEYLNSEKYELKAWDWDAPHSLRGIISTINRLRREHPALQVDDTLRFHPIANEQILAYTKHSATSRDVVLTVVSLDPHAPQIGKLELDLTLLPGHLPEAFSVQDLLTGESYQWDREGAYISLTPERPAHLFLLRCE